MIERRTASMEVRATGRQLQGYAAVFGTEAKLPGYTETIAPGAFAESLRSGRDILALSDHDPTKLLARTKSGSLTLREDATGLAFSFEAPETQAGNDALALATRGDLGGMSFGFTVGKGGDRWTGNRRELNLVHLHEISLVSAHPAYPGTTVIARMRPPVRLALVLRYLETVR